MTSTYGKILEILLKYLEVVFSSSSEDRKRLHDIEWEAEDDSPSILGEVEVRADTVIGIARTCLKRRPENISKLVYTLKESSVYQSDSIVSWLAVNGGDYQNFIGYMAAIENLRIGTIAFLEKT
ncbi:hypothetical protein A9Q99_24100 [Gammaproteobacteria bacterium 45_16_T64]|nr:hypothetical protein A9Q99_24100 [Gammaproteobacteria bacterium 45_16_T64]